MYGARALVAAVVSLLVGIVLSLVLASSGVPDAWEVMLDVLGVARDAVAEARAYDRSMDPAFNAAVAGARLAHFIASLLGIVGPLIALAAVLRRVLD